MQHALIRAKNPNAFRSGQWARITNPADLGPRICFDVEFLDGTVDSWPAEDGASHEFEFGPSLQEAVDVKGYPTRGSGCRHVG